MKISVCMKFESSCKSTTMKFETYLRNTPSSISTSTKDQQEALFHPKKRQTDSEENLAQSLDLAAKWTSCEICEESEAKGKAAHDKEIKWWEGKKSRTITEKNKRSGCWWSQNQRMAQNYGAESCKYCKYHIIHSPQGFSGIIYNSGWQTLPDCLRLRCRLQVMKEWVMMPLYMSVKVR